MAQLHRVVIAGAGLAGARTALSLRESGYGGEIVLVGDESHPPYERPFLSKDVLRGTRTLSDLLVGPIVDFADKSVELVLGRSVDEIDTAENTVRLSDGTSLRYSVLVLAMGASARALTCPNSDLPEVHTLRTYDDALRIVEHTPSGARCAVVGLGLVGSEVAASLRMRGLSVTAIEAAPGPMYRILGDEVSARMTELHRSAGVDVRLGVTVDSAIGDSHVRGLDLSDGSTVRADVVIAGLGAISNTSIALAAGIACNRGILTDNVGRTAVPNIFAVGDVAETFVNHLGRAMVLEHWQAAIKQAQRVAESIAGKTPVDESVAWFWSDQFGEQLQVIGHPDASDDVVVRGHADDIGYIAFHLRQGAVVAASAMRRGRELRRTANLILARTSCDRAALLDESVDVRSLVTS